MLSYLDRKALLEPEGPIKVTFRVLIRCFLQFVKVFPCIVVRSNCRTWSWYRDSSSPGQLSMWLWVSRNFKRRGRRCYFFRKVCTEKTILLGNISGSTEPFWIVILDCGLKLHKFSIHTFVMFQKWLEIH